jgi:hypothetical protein
VRISCTRVRADRYDVDPTTIRHGWLVHDAESASC